MVGTSGWGVGCNVRVGERGGGYIGWYGGGGGVESEDGR